jgi:hypothetical protein
VEASVQTLRRVRAFSSHERNNARCREPAINNRQQPLADMLNECETHEIGFIPTAPSRLGRRAAHRQELTQAASRLSASTDQIALAWLLASLSRHTAHPRHRNTRAPRRQPCSRRASPRQDEIHAITRSGQPTGLVAEGSRLVTLTILRIMKRRPARRVADRHQATAAVAGVLRLGGATAPSTGRHEGASRRTTLHFARSATQHGRAR